MHELTNLTKDWSLKQKYGWDMDDWESEILLPYMTQQAEKLMIEYYSAIQPDVKSIVNKYFGLSKPTLEEKLAKDDDENFDASTIEYWKGKVNICREHFKENPEELNNV